MASVGNYAYILTCKLRVATLRKTVNPLGFAHALRHLGDAHAYAGQTSRARACYIEALSTYRSQPNRRPLDLANAIRSLAALDDETGGTEEAERLWREAHDLYVSLNVTGGVAESAARLALLAWRRGDRQESRACLADAVAAANTGDDPDAREYVREVSAQIESSVA